MQVASCSSSALRTHPHSSFPKISLPASLAHNRLLIRAYIDVEAETASPNAPPGRWGSAPPPPPPPPPPQTRGNNFQAPNRREAMFAALGGLIGGLGVAAFYNSQYDLSNASGEKALDELLDDPEFLDTVADEVLYREFGDQMDGFTDSTEQLTAIGKEIASLKDDLEQAVEADVSS